MALSALYAVVMRQYGRELTVTHLQVDLEHLAEQRHRFCLPHRLRDLRVPIGVDPMARALLLSNTPDRRALNRPHVLHWSTTTYGCAAARCATACSMVQWCVPHVSRMGWCRKVVRWYAAG